MPEITWQSSRGEDRFLRTNELGARMAIDWEAQRYFYDNKFDRLEALYNLYLETDARTPSGVAKLPYLHWGIPVSTMARETGIHPDIEPGLNSWLEQYPNSRYAHLTRARILYEVAWKQRGGGYTHLTAPNQFAAMMATFDETRRYLEERAGSLKDDPQYYVTMLSIAFSSSAPAAEKADLLEEALTRHPESINIYRVMATFMQQKWGNDAMTLIPFAEDVSSRTPHLGDISYARALWAAWGDSSEFGTLVRDNKIDWPKLRSAFWELLEKYPATHNALGFMQMSCLAGDATTAEHLYSLAKETIDVAQLHEDARIVFCQERGILSPLES